MRDGIRFSLAAFGTVTFFATAYPALADTVEERRAKGAAVVSKLNNGVPQNNLENMRRVFPFLAEGPRPMRWVMYGRGQVSTTVRDSWQRWPRSPPWA